MTYFVDMTTQAEYAGHGFKYGGCDGQINMMKLKAKQVEKLDEEAALDAQDCASLQEDIELPLHLLSGWSKDDPNAPKALEEGEVHSGFIVELRDVSFGYSADKLLFSHVEFNVDSSSRIVMLGENGNGKSTLGGALWLSCFFTCNVQCANLRVIVVVVLDIICV
jgi:ATP-binding cassette, subfamily F, member 3